MVKVGRGSVGFPTAGRRHDAVHAQIFDHLSIVIVGVRHAEFRQAEARGVSFSHRLQHVFRSQGGGRLMTQRERVLQEFQDFGLVFMSAGPLPSLMAAGTASPVIGDQMK
jgi:hypothetical protein